MTLKARYVGLVGVVLGIACGSDATGGAPVISTLQNDNFTSGAPSFQSGFDSAEAAAVRLGPQGAAYTIRKVQLLFGGDTATKTVTLTIYEDAGTANPGTVLYSSGYSIKGSNSAFHEIDLTGQNIHVAANHTIRVSVAFGHVGVPSVATDASLSANRNLIYVNPTGWARADDLAMPGDFIIRAEISTP